MLRVPPDEHLQFAFEAFIHLPKGTGRRLGGVCLGLDLGKPGLDQSHLDPGVELLAGKPVTRSDWIKIDVLAYHHSPSVAAAVA